MSHVVHDAGEDGGELLLAGARHDGLLVRAVLRPQRGQQRHEHRQDVGPHLQQHGGNNDSSVVLIINCFCVPGEIE